MERIAQVMPPVAAPRHVADLRPAADAAATRRIDRPTGAVSPQAVPVPVATSQTAAVSRSLLAAGPTGTELARAAPPPDRVLKPYGVQMLPARDDARAADHRAPPPRGEGTAPPTTSPPAPASDASRTVVAPHVTPGAPAFDATSGAPASAAARTATAPHATPNAPAPRALTGTPAAANAAPAPVTARTQALPDRAPGGPAPVFGNRSPDPAPR